ncbi:MAG: DnaJ domain-containing protein [Planctomycetota bacterium]
MISNSKAFQNAIAQSSGRALAATTLMAWVASADQGLSSAQQRLLNDFAQSQSAPNAMELALGVVQSPSVDDLEAACNQVRKLSPAARQAFLKNAVHVANVEKRCSLAGGVVLQFLADITGSDLNKACADANCELPPVGDPSSIQWWKQSTASNREEEQPESAQKQTEKKPKGKRNQMSIEDARRILRLDATATEADIATGYRRLASLHHPDRHVHATEEAQREAARMFAEVRMAFERLTQQ